MSQDTGQAKKDDSADERGSRKNGHAKRARRRPAIHRDRFKEIKTAPELKRQTFYALENPRRAKLPAKLIGCFLFFLILANAVVIFISAQPGLDAGFVNIVNAFYTFSTACFLIEYIARIWIADLAFGDCTRRVARLKYVFSPLGIIDFLSFAPNVIAWFVPMNPALRTLVNVVRLVRLIKISRYMRGLRAIGRVLQKRRHEIVAAFLVLFLLIIVSSVVMYEIEHPAQPEKFNNLLSGIYWAVTTITATGYGDLVPITPAGRVVGSIIMFLSVALVAIPGGIMSAGFVAEFQNANYRKIERDIRSSDKKRAEGSPQAPDNENGPSGESASSGLEKPTE